MPSPTDLDSIVATIERLQALAGDSAAAPGEAANAAAHIQRLLFKHNLDMYEVRRRSKADAPRYDKYTVDLGSKNSNPYNSAWKQDLLSTLCRVNFCRSAFNMASSTAWIVGSPDNAEVVHRLYSYLVTELLRAKRNAWTAWTSAPDYLPRRNESIHYHRNFLESAVVIIASRLWDAFAIARDAGTSANALVVQTDKEVSEAMKRLFPGMGDMKERKLAKHHGAMRAGIRTGFDIQLQAAVDE